jgi:hypothetical protein
MRVFRYLADLSTRFHSYYNVCYVNLKFFMVTESCVNKMRTSYINSLLAPDVINSLGTCMLQIQVSNIAWSGGYAD